MEIGIGIINDIRQELESILNKCGIMYRLFARGKSSDSIKHKLNSSPNKYSPTGKKIQDGVGIRIVFYFLEDVKTFSEFLINQYPFDKYEDKSDSAEEIRNNETEAAKYVEIFGPQRLNLIFRMGESRAKLYIDELRNTGLSPEEYGSIDATYEVQLRSVLSEGWHEVEHDLRYKCKTSPMWQYCESESRSLNGIYASLETHEIAMELLFEKMAYSNYKNKHWEDMIRNHFRIKIHPYHHLGENNVRLLNSDVRLAKKILGISRTKFFSTLLRLKDTYPINFDNILYLTNRMLGGDACKKISENEPHIIREKLDKLFKLEIPN